jgi:Cerato-platanin
MLPYVYELSHIWTLTPQYKRAQDPGKYYIFSNDIPPGLQTYSLTLSKNTVMKLLSFIIPLTAILPAAYSVTVRYDAQYDNADISLTAVACSDGENGLLTKGYETFGKLPNFPHIGAAFAVEGYNSASCGSCWELTYTKSDGTSKTIYVTAIDHAADGFNIGETALKDLGGQQAVNEGHIEVTAERVAESNCVLNT